MKETKGATQKDGILRGASAPKEDVGARHPFQVAHVQRIQGGEDKRDAVKDCSDRWVSSLLSVLLQRYSEATFKGRIAVQNLSFNFFIKDIEHKSMYKSFLVSCLIKVYFFQLRKEKAILAFFGISYTFMEAFIFIY